MKFADMSDEEFIAILRIYDTNNGIPCKTKTDLQTRKLLAMLEGTAEFTELDFFDEAAIIQLFESATSRCVFKANLYRECIRRHTKLRESLTSK